MTSKPQVDLKKGASAIIPKRLDLDASMDMLIYCLQLFFEDVAKHHKQDLIGLETSASGRHGFYMQACIAFEGDEMPIRNMLVHEDRFGSARFQTVQDLLTTAELGRAASYGAPPVLPLRIYFQPIALNLMPGGTQYNIDPALGRAPKLLAQIVENDLSVQTLTGALKLGSVNEKMLRMQSPSLPGDRYPYARILQDQAADVVVEFDFETDREELLLSVAGLARAGETADTGEPMMTFNTFERRKDMPQCSDCKTMYLAMKVVNRLVPIGFGNVQLPSTILLRFDQPKTMTVDQIRKATMAVLRQQKPATDPILAAETLSRWMMQLWVMPQVNREDRKLFLHEGQAWRDFLCPAWLSDSRAACLYVEAHLVPYLRGNSAADA